MTHAKKNTLHSTPKKEKKKKTGKRRYAIKSSRSQKQKKKNTRTTFQSTKTHQKCITNSVAKTLGKVSGVGLIVALIHFIHTAGKKKVLDENETDEEAFARLYEVYGKDLLEAEHLISKLLEDSHDLTSYYINDTRIHSVTAGGIIDKVCLQFLEDDHRKLPVFKKRVLDYLIGYTKKNRILNFLKQTKYKHELFELLKKQQASTEGLQKAESSTYQLLTNVLNNIFESFTYNGKRLQIEYLSVGVKHEIHFTIEE